jgi:cytochrome c(L)
MLLGLEDVTLADTQWRAWVGLFMSLIAAACLGLAGLGFAQDATPAKKLNKYTGNAEAINEGRALYLKYGCSGCHGVGGGGGMGPPVTDDVWKFGSSDEALFKLIKGEVAESTMPKVFTLTDDEVWKMIAYIRSVYAGDPSKVTW